MQGRRLQVHAVATPPNERPEAARGIVVVAAVEVMVTSGSALAAISFTRKGSSKEVRLHQLVRQAS